MKTRNDDKILDYKGIFNLKTEKHVSWMYTAFGMLIFIGGAAVAAAESPFPAIIVLALGAAIFFMHKGVMIMPAEKKYVEYTSFLGNKKGKEMHYETVEYLFITRRGQGHTMNYRSMQSNASYMEYLGSVRFSEKEKLVLVVEDSAEKVKMKLKPLAAKWQVEIVDYTSEE